jgi:hypothetical protein
LNNVVGDGLTVDQQRGHLTDDGPQRFLFGGPLRLLAEGGLALSGVTVAVVKPGIFKSFIEVVNVVIVLTGWRPGSGVKVA